MTNSQPFKFENYVAPKQYYQVDMVDAKTGDVVMTSKVFDSYTDSSCPRLYSNTNSDKYFFNISYLTNYPDYEHEAKTPASFINPFYREEFPRNPPVPKFQFTQANTEKKVNKMNGRRYKNERPSRKSIHKNKNVRSKDVFNIDSIDQQFKRLRFGNVAKKNVDKAIQCDIEDTNDTNTDWNIVDNSLNSVHEELGNLNLHVNKSEEQILNSLVDEIDENEMNSTDNDDKLFDDMIIQSMGRVIFSIVMRIIQISAQSIIIMLGGCQVNRHGSSRKNSRITSLRMVRFLNN